MVRLLYVLSVVVASAACAIFGLCVWRWRGTGSQREILPQFPSAVQRFRESTGERQAEDLEKTSPLIVQAEIFASYLNPPQLANQDSPKILSMPEIKQETVEPVAAIWPAAPSVRFKLCATSYYPNEPHRSMALISDVGSPEGDRRWVKEGAKLGHFVIHEIRRGMIVYRDGEQLREMAVERSTELPRLVRDTRPASPTALAAPPAKPDSIEIRGD